SSSRPAESPAGCGHGPSKAAGRATGSRSLPAHDRRAAGIDAGSLPADRLSCRQRLPARLIVPRYDDVQEKPMPRKLEDVEQEALELKLDDRAALAEKLLHSLEGLSE